ncbi:reverse transcriptase domain-containing protein [Actinokineospora sp. G85]|uniref:reverse transcriptase domain-containing protein n=1 Tax=Actinokineospora sp. G85 TaxID=3406626 RepID=UPI003C7442A5
MPGADGVGVAEFGRSLGPRLRLLGDLLRSGGYQAQPVRLVPSTRGGRRRERGVPTVADRIAQRAVLHVCGSRLQSSGSETSFAYQRGRSWMDALAKARHHGENGLRWVFRTDIADYFASIDHQALRSAVADRVRDDEVTDLIAQWSAAPVLSDDGVRDVRRGIPEGAPISPALANLFLAALDRAVDGRHGRLVRYADDLALFCPDLDSAVAGAEHILLELAALGLRANQAKTYLSSFEAGFRLLGWEFEGGSGRPPTGGGQW